MYDKNFRRVEIKYLLTEDEKEKIISKINEHIEKDIYYKSTIENIYFDSNYNDLIVKSLEKPLFKEKVRIRSYETPSKGDCIFIELKNKYKGIVSKRRTMIKLDELDNFLNDDYDKSNQILKEIKYHIDYYGLYPKLFIAYDRESFKGKEDDNLRITFDSNLRSRKDDLKLESGDYGENYFDKSHIIMEVKTLDSLPLWFTSVLSELKIYPKSFSKYGSIYKKESENLC